jgi:hypothetical protein
VRGRMKATAFAAAAGAVSLTWILVAEAGDRTRGDREPRQEPLSGTLERCGDEWCVGSRELDFGPPWHLERTRARHDYDGDGERERIAAEIADLEHKRVALEVRIGRRGDADVFVIEGKAFRARPGPPPWAGRPPWAGPPAERDTRRGHDQGESEDRGEQRGPPWLR